MANDQPHDSLIKWTFSNPVHAEGELRLLLPAAVGERVDWSTLALAPGSFVDEELKQRHTDILFTAQLDRDPILIYLLLEHQSSIDPLMPFRVLRYVVRIWDRWLQRAENEDASVLPVVVPLVLYTGGTPWPDGHRRLADIVRLDSEAARVLGEHIPHLTLLIDDLAALGKDAALMRQGLTVLAHITELLTAYLEPTKPLELLEEAWPLLQVLARKVHTPAGFQDFGAVVNYILKCVAAHRREEVMAMVQAHLDKTEGEPFFSIADQLKQEGIAQGIEKGRESEAARAVLAVFDARGMLVPDDVRARIETCDDLDLLQRWHQRAVIVASPADIFAD